MMPDARYHPGHRGIGRTASPKRTEHIVLRCQSQNDPLEYHWIELAIRGHALLGHICSCGMDYCAHVDATIRQGELAMVHPEDILTSIDVHQRVGHQIIPPANWKASWIHNRRWRKLPERRRLSPAMTGKPSVHFTGRKTGSLSRRIFEQHAAQKGWMVISSLTRHATVIVSEKPEQIRARFDQDPRPMNSPLPAIITYNQWLLWQDDIRERCLERLLSYRHRHNFHWTGKDRAPCTTQAPPTSLPTP